MEYSIIIPQFGQSHLTVQAVRTFQQCHRSIDAEIIVVDDGSPTSHLHTLQRELGGCVRLSSLQIQSGITAAWNHAAHLAQGSCLVFLNNDTVTHGPWLELLAEPLREKQYLLTGCGWRRELDLPPVLLPEFQSTPFLVGWCFALRRGTFNDLKGFDETLRLYFSDTDLQCRLRRAYPDQEVIGVIEDLDIKHLEHQSTKRLSNRSRVWRRDRHLFHQQWVCWQEQE